MSRVVDPADAARWAQEAPRRTRGKETGWERWADGETHELVQGEDFDGENVNFARVGCQQWGRRKGLRVRTHILREGAGGSFSFQVLDGDPKRGGRPLTPEIVKAAKEIQRLEAEGAPGDEVARAFRMAKRVIDGLPPLDEKPGPLAKRRARLAKEAADLPNTAQNSIYDVVAARKPGAGRRKSKPGNVTRGGLGVPES